MGSSQLECLSASLQPAGCAAWRFQGVLERNVLKRVQNVSILAICPFRATLGCWVG